MHFNGLPHANYTLKFNICILLICCSCIMKDINELGEDMMELKPTFLAGVPRVFERIHEG